MYVEALAQRQDVFEGFTIRPALRTAPPHTRGWAPIPTSGCQVPDPVSARSPYPAAFVREYRLDLNATQAAIRAGYSPKTACIIGHENLRKPKIKAVLAESEAKALAKADLSAQNVLEAIRRHLMRDVRQLVGEDGTFKPLHELTPDQIEMIDKITEDADGTVTYRIESLLKWVEMAAKHFSLLTERVELVDYRHVEDKLIEARDRAVKAGHAKKHPDVGKAT